MVTTNLIDNDELDCVDLDDEKWESDFRPVYKPDWGEGQIHLDGERDFPYHADALECAESLRERVEKHLGGWVRINEEAQTFSTSAQMGELEYTVHFELDEDAGEYRVTKIDFKEYNRNGDDFQATYTIEEMIEHAKKVTKPLIDALKNAE